MQRDLETKTTLNWLISGFGSIQDVADYIGVHNVHIYNAMAGTVSKKLDKAMIKKGLLDPPKKRVRMQIDFDSIEDRERFREIILYYGSPSEFARLVIDGGVLLEKNNYGGDL